MKSQNITDTERAEMRLAREAASLTQAQAAELVYSDLSTYQNWEAGTCGMHRAIYERLMQWLAQLVEYPDET